MFIKTILITFVLYLKYNIMMIVKIIEDRSEHGYIFPLVGEYYKAIPYRLDSDKITLVYQVDPKTFKKLDVQYSECSDNDPLTNEYKCNVEIINI